MAPPPTPQHADSFAQKGFVLTFANNQLFSNYLAVSVSILSVPETLYKNYKPYDPVSFYGKYQLVRGTYVISTGDLTSENQIVFERNRTDLQIGRQIRCDIQRAARALGSALGVDISGIDFSDEPTRFHTGLIDSIAFRLLPGVSARLTVIWDDGREEYCNIGENPIDDRNEIPHGSKNPTVVPSGGSQEAPYGDGTDAPNGLDTDEDSPDDIKPPRPVGTTFTVTIHTNRANTGLPCGQEVTEYTDTFSISSTAYQPDVQVAPGTNFRTYCGKELYDGINVTVDGGEPFLALEGAGFFELPTVVSVVPN